MGKDNSPTFYAVARGRNPGVYKTWSATSSHDSIWSGSFQIVREQCEEQTKNVKGSRYKKFHTEQEALEYVENHGFTSTQPSSSRRNEPVASSSKIDQPREGWLTVYCDGASKNNGGPNAVAGIGVWWGKDDERWSVREWFSDKLPFDRIPVLGTLLSAVLEGRRTTALSWLWLHLNLTVICWAHVSQSGSDSCSREHSVEPRPTSCQNGFKVYHPLWADLNLWLSIDSPSLNTCKVRRTGYLVGVQEAGWQVKANLLRTKSYHAILKLF